VSFVDLEHRYEFGAKDTKRKKMRELYNFLHDNAALHGTFVVGNKTFLVQKRQRKDAHHELLIASYDVVIPGYPYNSGTYRTWTGGHVNVVHDMIVFWLRDDIPPDVFYL
jgi:hypothetical protein